MSFDLIFGIAIAKREGERRLGREILSHPSIPLLLIGPPSAGKTTLANRLLSTLNYRHYISIDEIRKRFLKDKLSDEYLSWYHFLKKMEEIDAGIFEFSGTGIHRHYVRMILERKKPYLVIELTASIDSLLQRIGRRRWNYPNLLQLDPLSQLLSNIRDLEKLREERFWRGSLYIFKDTSSESIDNIASLVSKILREITDLPGKTFC